MKLIGFEDGGAVIIGRVEGEEVVRLADRDTFWRDPHASIAAAAGRRLSS